MPDAAVPGASTINAVGLEVGLAAWRLAVWSSQSSPAVMHPGTLQGFLPSSAQIIVAEAAKSTAEQDYLRSTNCCHVIYQLVNL